MSKQILAQLLENQAAVAAQAVGLRCNIGKLRRIPRDADQIGEFWYVTGTPLYHPRSYRGSVEKAVGVLQFTVYSAERLGKGCSLSVGERLRDAVARSILAYDRHFILLGHLESVELPRPHDGWIINIVDGSFSYFSP